MAASFTAAKAILGLSADLLVAAGRELPDRVCVQPGADPSWDGCQLTIAVIRPSVPGAVGVEDPRARARPMPRYAELRLELVRCLTLDDDGSSTVEQWEADAEDLLLDADVWQNGLTPDAITAAIGTEPHRGAPVTIGAISTLGPLGGLASITTVLAVPL